MAEQVHIYPKIERQLTALEKQTNAPAIAADRARQIIEALIHGTSPTVTGLMKPRADQRVKNSLKFNLGSGFRLICIKEKKIIYVMFVGDHDQCDAWLNNFSKRKPHKTELDMEAYTVADPVAASAIPESEPLESLDISFDDPLYRQISQADLRRVFKGLTQ